MNISELFTIRYPFLKKQYKSKAGLFDFFVLKSIDEENQELISRMKKMGRRQKADIVRGNASISNVASLRCGSFDDAVLYDSLADSLSLKDIRELVELLKPSVPDINESNFLDKVCRLFQGLIADAAQFKPKTKNNRNKKNAYSICCDVVHMSLLDFKDNETEYFTSEPEIRS